MGSRAAILAFASQVCLCACGPECILKKEIVIPSPPRAGGRNLSYNTLLSVLLLLQAGLALCPFSTQKLDRLIIQQTLLALQAHRALHRGGGIFRQTLICPVSDGALCPAQSSGSFSAPSFIQLPFFPVQDSHCLSRSLLKGRCMPPPCTAPGHALG